MNERLQALGPRHHAAIRLKLDGASGSEIADALDVQTRTVYLWMGDPLVKEELARQLDRIGDEFARELALAATTALAELRKMAELPVDGPLGATDKLRCIQEIFDRVEPSLTASRPTRISDEIGRLSDDELIAHARELVGGDP
jgi:hypothetical protein